MSLDFQTQQHSKTLVETINSHPVNMFEFGVSKSFISFTTAKWTNKTSVHGILPWSYYTCIVIGTLEWWIMFSSSTVLLTLNLPILKAHQATFSGKVIIIYTEMTELTNKKVDQLKLWAQGAYNAFLQWCDWHIKFD